MTQTTTEFRPAGSASTIGARAPAEAAVGSAERTAAALNAAFAGLDVAARLRLLRQSVDGRVVLTTSFGIEDQALTHFIANSGIDVHLATLDTGRLFRETYDVWAATCEGR